MTMQLVVNCETVVDLIAQEVSPLVVVAAVLLGCDYENGIYEISGTSSNEVRFHTPGQEHDYWDIADTIAANGMLADKFAVLRHNGGTETIVKLVKS